MSSLNTISIDKLNRLIGTPQCPSLIDVQTDDDFAADPRLVPGAVRRPWTQAADWADEFAGGSAVVICQKGLKLSQGVAAWLRHSGVPAEVLEGGAVAWGDVMIDEFGLHTPPLDRLALIVRSADTARPDLAPEAAGLLAASLGLSRMFTEDLPQLEAGMLVYDAFYRWCRDATSETHNWPVKRGA